MGRKCGDNTEPKCESAPAEPWKLLKKHTERPFRFKEANTLSHTDFRGGKGSDVHLAVHMEIHSCIRCLCLFH